MSRGRERRPLWWDRWVLLVLTSGIAASIVGFVAVERHDRQQARKEFEARAKHVAARIEQDLVPAVEMVTALASFFESSEHVSVAEFAAFTEPALRRHRSLIGLEWAPRVAGADRQRFEQEQQEELSKFQVWEPVGETGQRRAPESREHFPLLHMMPALESMRGLDLSFEEGRRQDIGRALERGDLTLTDRFRLVEHPPDVFTVAAYVPAYDLEGPAAKSGGKGPARGLAIGLVRVERSVRRALDGHEKDAIGVVVRDDGAPADKQLLYASSSSAETLLSGTSPEDRFELAFPVGDRSWTIQCASLVPLGSNHAYWYLAVWLISTVLAAAATGVARRFGDLRARAERGERLGQYRLLTKLGEGDMGEVYTARHALLRRQAAIKVIRRGTVGEQMLVRFEREAHAASELRHPNTVTIYDFGRTPDGALYYAMELVEGIDLHALVQKVGPLPPSRVVHLLVQASGALAEAHAKGLVHRDVKPANIMVCQQGGVNDFVKVLDFGLVKLDKPIDDHTKLSANVEILGTPHYMAPEQMTDPSAVGPQADVYALGAVAYFLLTGRDVFTAPTTSMLIMKCLTEEPKPLSQRRAASVDPALEALVMRCLSKDPTERPSSAADLRRQLGGLDRVKPWTEADAAQWWTGNGQALLEEQSKKHGSAHERLTVALTGRSLTPAAQEPPADTLALGDSGDPSRQLGLP